MPTSKHFLYLQNLQAFLLRGFSLQVCCCLQKYESYSFSARRKNFCGMRPRENMIFFKQLGLILFLASGGVHKYKLRTS